MTSTKGSSRNFFYGLESEDVVKFFFYFEHVAARNKTSEERATELLSHLDGSVVFWASENPGMAVVIGGPGFRQDSTGLRPFVVGQQNLPFSMQELSCADAAFAHAVMILRGRRFAEGALKAYEGKMRVGSSLKERTRKFSLGGHGLSLKDPKDNALKDFKAYDVRSDRVFILRLQNREMDHLVCVDAKEGEVLDSELPRALSMSARVLRICAGATPSSRISEVRIVVDDRFDHNWALRG